MMALRHFKQLQTPHLPAVSMLLMLAISAGSALAQTAPTDPGTPTPSVEPRKEKGDAAAIADCEAMWDRDTHMTKKQWSLTCRRVQARIKQIEW